MRDEEIELAIKNRDALQLLVDAWQNYIESKAPPEILEGKQSWTWNPEKITWTEKTGQKGLYEQSEDANTAEFKALLKDLAAHDRKLTRDGYFYWSFRNGLTVGRKKRN